MSDAILVGCVGPKLDHPAPAKELYRSQLWNMWRSYAESAGLPWFIVSAGHGLIDPSRVTAPYDANLASLSTEEKRSWAQGVVHSLVRRLGDLSGLEIELHVGGLYKVHLPPPLLDRRAVVLLPEHTGPTRGMSSWRRWYENAARGQQDWITVEPERKTLSPREWQRAGRQRRVARIR